MKQKIPTYTLKNLAKKSGIKRISREALKEIESLALDLVEKTTKQAIIYANHGKRITIKEEDVKLATGE